jgi:hypothetical protein
MNVDKDIRQFFSDWALFRSTWFIHKDEAKLIFFLEQSIGIAWNLMKLWHSHYGGKAPIPTPIYGRFPTVFLE